MPRSFDESSLPNPLGFCRGDRDKSTIVAWRTTPCRLDEQARAVLGDASVEVRDVAGRDVREEITKLDNSPVYSSRRAALCRPARRGASDAAG